MSFNDDVSWWGLVPATPINEAEDPVWERTAGGWPGWGGRGGGLGGRAGGGGRPGTPTPGRFMGSKPICSWHINSSSKIWPFFEESLWIKSRDYVKRILHTSAGSTKLHLALYSIRRCMERPGWKWPIRITIKTFLSKKFSKVRISWIIWHYLACLFRALFPSIQY